MRTSVPAGHLRFALLVSLVASLLGLAIGADDPVAGKRGASEAPFRKTPERARLRPNPLASDPNAIAAGKKLFRDHCAQCHGQAAEGGKAPSLDSLEVENATAGEIFWLLTNGVVRRGMPDWSKLPEPERWQLTAYIKALSRAPRRAPIDAPHDENPPREPARPNRR
ncbi:MAG: c-type cytochrome [Acidobacteria bacterium]|nr:c-type cytochrome [Acidobacteriota bacterium]